MKSVLLFAQTGIDGHDRFPRPVFGLAEPKAQAAPEVVGVPALEEGIARQAAIRGRRLRSAGADFDGKRTVWARERGIHGCRAGQGWPVPVRARRNHFSGRNWRTLA